jgi:hypothetical protein
MPRRASFILWLVLAPAVLGCRRREPPPVAPPPPPAAAEVVPPAPLALPEVVPGYAAGPVTRGPDFVRRNYAKGAAVVTVTLARYGGAAQAGGPDNPAAANAAYDSWVETSVSGYPQAALDVAPGTGNGFYQCADPNDRAPRPTAICDLLIQLRPGVHIELRGGGTATRADVDAIARALPLRALAGSDGGRPATAVSQGVVSFRRDVVPVLAKSCTGNEGCHGDQKTRRVDLDLRGGPTTYESLVGRRAQMRAGALRVDPGHPARSFVVDKLTRHLGPHEGQAMPMDPETGAPVEQSPVESFVWKTLIPWISQGAGDN